MSFLRAFLRGFRRGYKGHRRRKSWTTYVRSLAPMRAVRVPRGGRMGIMGARARPVERRGGWAGGGLWE